MTTMERFKEVLKPVTDPPFEVVASTTIRSLHLGPLDLVKLICEVEDEFDIELADDQAEKFQTVGDLIFAIDAAKGATHV
jgi:acyl carrier protein